MQRPGALGLRGRIVGAVIVTTVATLVVAALALLGPLEHSLRSAALTTLKTEVKGARGATNFQSLDLRYVLDASSPSDPHYAAGREQGRRLRRQQLNFGQRIGATVFLVGYADPSGRNGRILAPPPDNAVVPAPPWGLIAQAYRLRRPQYSFASQAGGEYAVAAIPFTKTYNNGTAHDLDGTVSVHYLLAVSKPIDEVNAAVTAVRTAFLTAAAAGLVLTLLLAIPLAFTIVRRLRELRRAALQLAEGEPVKFSPDRGRDEVGDLGRAFALMQAQLRHQEEARRSFVATASHELRTPLTSLEGMLELLEDDLASPHPDLDDARALLERARAQSHRLGRLAADLLDLSRIDAQVQLRSEPVELRELSRAVLAEFQLGLDVRGVGSELRDHGNAVWALGDPGSVARILRILLDNALRVSPPGSEVVIELHGGEAAELRVCDEGPGVPLEERALIFERFHRGRETSRQGGFGLGLAIGRELAERMGGELRLEDGSGPGATFVLRLPVATAPEQAALLAH